MPNEIERMMLICRSPLWAIRPDSLSSVVELILHGSRSARAARPSQRGEVRAKWW